jgi:hypothetical protein
MPEEVFLGEWWLPDCPEKKIKGALIVFDNSCMLFTTDYFDEEISIGKKRSRGPSREYYKLLIGMTCLKGQSVLYNVSFWDDGGFNEQQIIYKVQIAILGCFLDEGGNPIIKKWDFELPSNIEWSGLGQIENEVVNSPEPVINIEVKPKGSIPGGLYNSINIKVGCSLSVPGISNKQCYQIPQNPGFILEPLEATSIFDLQSLSDQLSKLVMFSLGSPVRPKISEIDTYDKLPRATTLLIDKTDYLAFQTLDIEAKDLYFTIKELYNINEEYARNWLIYYDKYKYFLDQYFAIIYNANLYLEHKVLNLCFALEVYHRIKHNSNELSDINHNERVKRIVESAPTGFKRWLKDKLIYSNEKSFIQCIKEILQYIMPECNIFKGFDLDSLSKEIKDMRNKLVHYKEDTDIDYIRLKDIYYILKIINEMIILRDIGFNSEYVINKVKYHRYYGNHLFRYDELKSY